MASSEINTSPDEKPIKKERKERGLKRLKDGRFQFSWVHENHYHRRIAETKTEARNYLNKIRSDIREGRYLDMKSVVKTPFEEGVERFLKWTVANTSSSNQKLDHHCARSWLDFLGFKGKTMDVITGGDVERYKEHLLEGKIKNGTRRNGKPFSSTTVDIHIGRLKRMFHLCQEWGLCEVNPAAKVKLLRRDNKRIRYLGQEEEARLMEAASPLLKDVIQFALHTGMRRGELLGLKWSDIDFKRQVAVIPGRRAKGNRERVIPLNAIAMGILESFTRPLDSEELVFANRDGGKWDRLRKHWVKALAISKVEDFHFHDLRHTYASRLITSGVNLAVIRELLGHRDFETTLRYSHLSSDRLKEAVALLEKSGSNLRLTCDSESAQNEPESSPSVTEEQ